MCRFATDNIRMKVHLMVRGYEPEKKIEGYDIFEVPTDVLIHVKQLVEKIEASRV